MTRFYHLTFHFRDPTHKRADNKFVTTLQVEDDDLWVIKLSKHDLEYIDGQLKNGFVIFKIEQSDWKF